MSIKKDYQGTPRRTQRRTSSLDDGASLKEYCPGVGLVFDDGIVLTSYGMAK